MKFGWWLILNIKSLIKKYDCFLIKLTYLKNKSHKHSFKMKRLIDSIRTNQCLHIFMLKKLVQIGCQSYRFVNMEPHNSKFNLSAMSQENLEFSLPGVFTIGSCDDNR